MSRGSMEAHFDGLTACGLGQAASRAVRPWSSWTADSDKKLNVNKPYVTSRKTAFQKFCQIFRQFSRCHKFW